MRSSLRSFNKRLVKKGLRILPIRSTGEQTLVYVYRPSKLKKDLCDKEAQAILLRCGYRCADSERCVIQLIERMKSKDCFPHEIGLFLGYPPEDVEGFIRERENSKERKPCKCVGHWKVYGDEDIAKALFISYRNCENAYNIAWQSGKSIENLTVSV